MQFRFRFDVCGVSFFRSIERSDVLNLSAHLDLSTIARATIAPSRNTKRIQLVVSPRIISVFLIY